MTEEAAMDDTATARLAELERRLGALEDDKAVRELIVRHDYCFDTMRDDDWLELWTGDGVYDLLSTLHYPDGSVGTVAQRWQGPEELRQFIANPETHHRPGFYGHSMHMAGQEMVVHVDGDHATATSYSLLFQEVEGSLSILSGANSAWTLRRVDGVWKLRERRRRQVGTPEFAANLW
jgi:SnoaL-like domain